jgi:hypothetical protein
MSVGLEKSYREMQGRRKVSQVGYRLVVENRMR